MPLSHHILSLTIFTSCNNSNDGAFGIANTAPAQIPTYPPPFEINFLIVLAPAPANSNLIFRGSPPAIIKTSVS